ncbi:MlaD family protein [Nocardia sp. NPDC057353]|uniref:MlaD family protein n=1 Tax=Nocardia sp. NPDC057353 TaxID=3346104 RepID=UPI00362E9768
MSAIVELPARALLAAVRALVPHRLALSAAGLAVTLVVAGGYLTFGALGADPAAETFTVRVRLAESGGLLPGQEVTVRGFPVGEVRAIHLEGGGVVAEAEIDAAYPIPDDGAVQVVDLSTAGEQYLDFRPTRSTGPYLGDGSVIGPERTATPVPLWRLLGTLDSTLAQVDPRRLEAMVAELGAGPEAPRKLGDIVRGGMFLVATLDSVLPQTVALIRDTAVVSSTVAGGTDELRALAADTAQTMRGVEAKTGGYVRLLDTAPGTLAAVDAVLAASGPSIVGLLTGLSTLAEVTNSRVPALQEFFFPAQRAGSALDALSVIMRDGGIWGLVNLYPRYSCDYDVPRHAPSVPDYAEPYLYTGCPAHDPSILVRGANNAPRPPGEPIPGLAPPGADPHTTAGPAPVGPWTIPLPIDDTRDTVQPPR